MRETGPARPGTRFLYAAALWGAFAWSVFYVAGNLLDPGPSYTYTTPSFQNGEWHFVTRQGHQGGQPVSIEVAVLGLVIGGGLYAPLAEFAYKDRFKQGKLKWLWPYEKLPLAFAVVGVFFTMVSFAFSIWAVLGFLVLAMPSWLVKHAIRLDTRWSALMASA